jgi:hypothetical protein
MCPALDESSTTPTKMTSTTTGPTTGPMTRPTAR